ncbi:hypothetical protein HPP92_002160 [Vanilla planifolia]|nr:hypothetical protein HPP92_002160 [Vanilla planifolia]
MTTSLVKWDSVYSKREEETSPSLRQLKAYLQALRNTETHFDSSRRRSLGLRELLPHIELPSSPPPPHFPLLLSTVPPLIQLYAPPLSISGAAWDFWDPFEFCQAQTLLPCCRKREGVKRNSMVDEEIGLRQ